MAPGADDEPRDGLATAPRGLERAVGLALVAACCLYLFWQLNPDAVPWRGRFGALFTDTTPNGGDMGAHVWWPDFLREHWFGRGRLSGWAPDHYAGFPAGQFYFPVPALAIAALDLVLPYNVAFKLVTVSGPVLLPIGAYVFARGLRVPWPGAPLFAVASVRFLYEVRRVDGEETWTIWGGNLPSTLAGEFAFTLALALALGFLGVLAVALRTGRWRAIAAGLLAIVVLTHIIVGVFAVVGAVAIWASYRPRRTVGWAAAIGGTAFLLAAIWVLPVLAGEPYTASMRYEKVGPDNPLVADQEVFTDYLFRLPWWMWTAVAVAVGRGLWARRRATAVLAVMAVAFAALFWHWPEHHVWNARYLPFYYLVVGFLVATGVAEALRGARRLVGAGLAWVAAVPGRARVDGEIVDGEIVDGEIVDGEIVDGEVVDGEVIEGGGVEGAGSEGDEDVRRHHVAVASRVVAAALLAVVGVGVLVAAHAQRSFIPSWTAWNYRGYEALGDSWTELETLVDTMDGLARADGPGRALWEPDSEALNRYGTPLALMLLPYWTEGRVASMEGVYFESAATMPYHFLTVSHLAPQPSNPVRGLVYGSFPESFDLGVEQMRRLGVRWYMAHSPAAREAADAHDGLTLVAEAPDVDGLEPRGWRIYEVEGSVLVEGLPTQPVVVTGGGGTRAECFGSTPQAHEPELTAWECAAAPWWQDGTNLDRPFAAGGPASWRRVHRDALGRTAGPRLDPVVVSGVEQSVDRVRFRVDRPGIPVLVRVSYFPNWEVRGADGPWRVAPNFMVVVPTDTEVELVYGLTGADRLGRLLSVTGLAALAALVWWGRRRRSPHEAGVDPGGTATMAPPRVATTAQDDVPPVAGDATDDVAPDPGDPRP